MSCVYEVLMTSMQDHVKHRYSKYKLVFFADYDGFLEFFLEHGLLPFPSCQLICLVVERDHHPSIATHCWLDCLLIKKKWLLLL